MTILELQGFSKKELRELASLSNVHMYNGVLEKLLSMMKLPKDLEVKIQRMLTRDPNMKITHEELDQTQAKSREAGNLNLSLPIDAQENPQLNLQENKNRAPDSVSIGNNELQVGENNVEKTGPKSQSSQEQLLKAEQERISPDREISKDKPLVIGSSAEVITGLKVGESNKTKAPDNVDQDVKGDQQQKDLSFFSAGAESKRSLFSGSGSEESSIFSNLKSGDVQEQSNLLRLLNNQTSTSIIQGNSLLSEMTGGPFKNESEKTGTQISLFSKGQICPTKEEKTEEKKEDDVKDTKQQPSGDPGVSDSTPQLEEDKEKGSPNTSGQLRISEEAKANSQGESTAKLNHNLPVNKPQNLDDEEQKFAINQDIFGVPNDLERNKPISKIPEVDGFVRTQPSHITISGDASNNATNLENKEKSTSMFGEVDQKAANDNMFPK